MMHVYVVKWSCFSGKMRIPAHGELEIAANGEQDAIEAVYTRWPEIIIEDVRRKTNSDCKVTP